MRIQFKEFPVELFFSLALLLFLSFTILVYWPGLGGTWLLDDYENLEGLSQIAADPTLKKLMNYLLSPINRPVALLSFAAQYHYWPNDIGSFKYINLMIHLLNGLLLYWILLKLCRALNGDKEKILGIATLTTALWLLHPLQVSTVLYVVQRMASLATFFMLTTIAIFLHGREKIAYATPLSTIQNSYQLLLRYVWLSIGIFLFSTLATLSKENGSLVFIYIIVIENTIFAKSPLNSKHWQTWFRIFIYLPIILLSIYIVLSLPEWLARYQIRPFNLTERLLTEFRALSDYLFKLFCPRPESFGLYFDDFPISTSIINPPTTFTALTFILLLIYIAFKWRKQTLPILSFGILWFLGGHLLESTIVPLEVYWEHRNYLPILGPLFAFSYYTLSWSKKYQKINRFYFNYITFFLFLFPLLLALMTYNETKLWGDSLLQAAVWAKVKPDSRRAQENFAGMLARSGQLISSYNKYAQLAETDLRESNRYYSSWLTLTCLDNNIPLPDQEKFKKSLTAAPFSYASPSNLSIIINLVEKNECSRINYNYLLPLLQALLDNHNYANLKFHIYFLIGRLHAVEGLLDPAMLALDEATRLQPSSNPAIISYQIKWLVSAQLYDDALKYVTKARSINSKNKFKGWLYESEIDGWEKQIRGLINK